MGLGGVGLGGVGWLEWDSWDLCGLWVLCDGLISPMGPIRVSRTGSGPAPPRTLHQVLRGLARNLSSVICHLGPATPFRFLRFCAILPAQSRSSFSSL